MRKVFGVGINDADYVTRKFKSWREEGKKKNKMIWICPYFKSWTSMLSRCYYYDFKTYEDKNVCEEWLKFSNFKAWMETQEWEGLELDKDILIKDNKTYSPATCAFVPRFINLIVLNKAKNEGSNLPIGVAKRTSRGLKNKLYVARVNDCVTKQYRQIGNFSSKAEAHAAWQMEKAAELEKAVLKYKEECKGFRTDVAAAILDRAWRIRTDCSIGVETKSI